MLIDTPAGIHSRPAPFKFVPQEAEERHPPMRSTRRAFLGIACLLAAFGQASGQEPKVVSDVTAIDVLLAPDDVMIARAKAANARLRADYPKGFELDATHALHITLIQRFVRTSDLDKVNAAIAKVLKDETPTSWELKATGYYTVAGGESIGDSNKWKRRWRIAVNECWYDLGAEHLCERRPPQGVLA
jgi:hypothetical protein